MKRFLHIKMTTTRIIVLGFLVGIILGAFLLWLPISSNAGKEISFVLPLAKKRNIIDIPERSKTSSTIQTVLSVLEFHQILR